MNRWSVVFFNAAGDTVHTDEVECMYAHNAAKVAVNRIVEQGAGATLAQVRSAVRIFTTPLQGELPV